MFDRWEFLLVMAALASVAFGIAKLDSRLRMIAARQGRLSLTFQRLKIDVDAIQSSLIVIAQQNPDALQRLIKIRDSREETFRYVVETGPTREEILRGLEWPDPKDDPVFWQGQPLSQRMGLGSGKLNEPNETDTK